MTTEATERAQVGDYDLRGSDPETELVGEIDELIIDADALVRDEWANGFPNWALYRTSLAGDLTLASALQDWTIGFAYRLMQTVVRASAWSDELAGAVALDALAMLKANREVAPYTVVASRVGVDPKTYKRLRDLLFRFLKATTDEYWIRLGAAYRYTIIRYRKA